ncbi:hypothetical protein D3C81_1653530 [compost metagenome]
MLVRSQRGVGFGVAVHLVDEAVQQLERGVEVEQVGFAGVGCQVLGAQAAHLGLQAFLVGRQLQGQAQCIGVGQRPAHVRLQ